ncbi:hypothetical protein E2562_018835 [Oryza meyeriana var. granulata]|uniref:Uncharacterized protein n=1 Tax=Oryza meyeriana var. granulata TaxID=110450 RepID=A0A6G1F9U5_9ORYZ|nr:hypothetical protein E2562_018835 [Oryza meyeriana var. granulata]
MEDSVGEEERREQEETMAQGKERGGEEDAGGGGGEPCGESGFLTTMASKIGAAVSGSNGSFGAEEEEYGEGNGDGNAVGASSGEEEGKRGGDGGGGIFGKLLSTETMADGKERGGGGVGGGVETDGEGGLLTTMASKIGAAMSGSNGSVGAEEEGGERNGDGNVAAASGGEGEGKREGNGGGGIFSKLVSGSSDSLPASVGTEEERKVGGDQGGEQAGILSTVASKIGIAMFGVNGHANHRNEDDAKISNGDAADHGKVKEKEDEPNGGGIVKQLISNLPTDDQAPDAEEASLLIAIIDD